MRIKALTNFGGNDYPDLPLQEGEEADVSDEIGSRIVARKHAVEVPAPPKPERKPTTPKAVEPPAESKPTK